MKVLLAFCDCLAAAGVTWFLNWVALMPFRRAEHAHWTERARLLWPARASARLNLFLLPAILVLAQRLTAPNSAPPWPLAALAAFVGAIGGSYPFDREAFPWVGPREWLHLVLSGWSLCFGAWTPFLAIAVLMPAQIDWRAWVLAGLYLASVVAWVSGGWVWCRQKLRLLAPAPERLQALVASVSARMRAPVRRVWLLQSPASYAAALPYTRELLFSARLLSLHPDEDLAAICGHELGHFTESRLLLGGRLLLSLLFFLPLLFVKPVALGSGAGGVISLGAASWLFGIARQRLSRRLERRADGIAKANEPDPGAYARALARLHESNLVPAVMPRKRTHPDLYDRLLAAGLQPDYARPKKPSVLSAFTFFLCVALGILIAANFIHTPGPVEGPAAIASPTPASAWLWNWPARPGQLLNPGEQRWPGNLPQEVYVWQRAWTKPVRQAVMEHGPSFARVVALAAEVTWQNGKPKLVRVPVDYDALIQTRRPLGLALRVGPYSGSFAPTNFAAVYLANLAHSLISDALAPGAPVSELQIDFDCASSKLQGYRSWMEVIRQAVTPVPLIITALPAWLDEPVFKSLAQTAGGYILQAHSLKRPTSFNAPFTLCDPAAARRAVAKAGEIGVPFRVALPTYGYTIAFDREGRFAGLSAEGPAKIWPAGVRTRDVRADPLELAKLVRDWCSNRPAAMKGIIWYRLPVPGDVLNWRWPTLSAILHARIPRKSVRVESRRVETGLVQISLVNDGELDISARFAVRVRWQGARLIAGDGLGGFNLARADASSARFEAAKPCHLPAGERFAIGWLRLSGDREIQVQFAPPGSP